MFMAIVRWKLFKLGPPPPAAARYQFIIHLFNHYRVINLRYLLSLSSTVSLIVEDSFWSGILGDVLGDIWDIWASRAIKAVAGSLKVHFTARFIFCYWNKLRKSQTVKFQRPIEWNQQRTNQRRHNGGGSVSTFSLLSNVLLHFHTFFWIFWLAVIHGWFLKFSISCSFRKNHNLLFFHHHLAVFSIPPFLAHRSTFNCNYVHSLFVTKPSVFDRP